MKILTVGEYLQKLQKVVENNPEVVDLPVYYLDADGDAYPVELSFEGCVEVDTVDDFITTVIENSTNYNAFIVN